MVGASFAALVVVSSLFAGSASGVGGGITDILSKIMEKINGFFETSPFGGIFGGLAPKAKTTYAEIYLYPDSFTLTPAKPLDITFRDITLVGFEGNIKPDFASGELVFDIKDSPVKINSSLSGLSLNGLELGPFAASGMKFSINPNITAENGTISAAGFSGAAFLGTKHIKLSGNFTSLKAKIGELTLDIN